jgi:hypothetical protein
LRALDQYKSYLQREKKLPDIFTYKIANPLATAGDTYIDDQKLEGLRIAIDVE